ncbi:glutamate--tRNA ligase [Hippea maritima]|uniref:Glutamate--tRNA ligase n=1 Tax=Hippea maritima (strain ATCC 700847 / DSM 10411 / MH2) TaxID=760142 RepID=F2LUT1_HIPMA|nr:glutamate--tRNA ligase [Hippea maritima]AEA33536.1 glutamyl-tRNA synthetase [Hippea maritima DSM 10411]
MVRTRFAPSPTGHLHIGGLRTAIFNYLFAKANGGEFILRIEDTDKERSREEFTQAILDGLEWCGINWDDICYQSKRNGIYEKYLNRLIEEGKAYRCYCSKERLERLKEEQLKRGENPHYDGHCRNLNEYPEDKPYVIRVKLPEDNIDFFDHLHGDMHFSYKEFDDFIIRRSDGSFMYNFTNVVDDIECGITHVIRGDDHLTNTAKQIVLYRLLGENPPEYTHVPMILGEDKTRLSKRHGAKSVLEYKQMGILPVALVNYLLRLGFSYGDKEIFSFDEMVKYFSLDRLNKSAAVFNPDKLIWVNFEHMKMMKPEELLKHLKPFLDEECFNFDDSYLIEAIKTRQTKAQTLVELADEIRFYCKPPEDYDKKALKKYVKASTREYIISLLEKLKDADFSSEETLEAVFESVLERFDIKMVKLAQPVRIALTGRGIGPGIYEMLMILGKNETINRLEKFLNAVF